MATLIRVLPAHIRNHDSQVQVQISEKSTYQELKERVLANETVSTSASQRRASMELGTTSNQGPVPMEIDMVNKGQNKGKAGGKFGEGQGKNSYDSQWSHAGKGKRSDKGGKERERQSQRGGKGNPHASRGGAGAGKGKGACLLILCGYRVLET